MRRSPTTRQPCLEWWTRQGSRRKNYHHSLPNPGKRSGPTMEARPIASITFSSQTWYPSINRIYKHWKWLPMCVQWFIRTYHAILKHDCSGDWKMSFKDWTEQTIKGPGIRKTFSVLFDVDEILIFSKKTKVLNLFRWFRLEYSVGCAPSDVSSKWNYGPHMGAGHGLSLPFGR